jgi:hypothetical protein
MSSIPAVVAPVAVATDAPALTPDVSKGQVDMSSILAKIQQLEQQNRYLTDEGAQKDLRLDKLTEAKKLEMQNVLQTTIARFIADLQTKDAKTKEDLTASLTNFANKGHDTGVWEVMACASAAHVERVTELENLRVENNALKERESALTGGVFGVESARIQVDSAATPASMKRKIDDISEAPSMWDDFHTMLNNNGGINSQFTA